MSFHVGIQIVHDAGCRLQAAHLGRLGTGGTGKLFLHDIVELLQRGRLHLFEVGNTHDEIQPDPLGKLAEDLGGLLGIQIGEHYGLDLGVFVLDDAGHLARIHPLE